MLPEGLSIEHVYKEGDSDRIPVIIFSISFVSGKQSNSNMVDCIISHIIDITHGFRNPTRLGFISTTNQNRVNFGETIDQRACSINIEPINGGSILHQHQVLQL